MPGLGSHALGSWKSPNSDDVWLRDFLPKDVPNIRVLLYGYDTVLPGSLSKQSIEDLGGALLEQVVAFRARDGVRDLPCCPAQANHSDLPPSDNLHRPQPRWPAHQRGEMSRCHGKQLTDYRRHSFVHAGGPVAQTLIYPKPPMGFFSSACPTSVSETTS